MGLVEIASSNSVWRGMDYYDNKKVVSWESSEPGVYDGVVSGSGDNTYTVHVDTVHPRKSIRQSTCLRKIFIKIRRNGLRVPILRVFILVILIQISVYEDKIYTWNVGEMPSGLDSYV